MRRHPWRARLLVGVIMLILAFIGMMITNIHFEGGWIYWKWMVPVYAILALWLSWYMRHASDTTALRPITLYHELLHWAGVIGTIFLIAYYANHGVISRFIEGIIDLTVLGLGVFLAGVYIEPIFLVIGVALGVFAVISALVIKYFYVVMVFVIFICILLLLFMTWLRQSKK